MRALGSVAVGDTVGPVTVPVTRETLVAYANASGDQNPIHQDEAFARSVGLPDVIAHGMWTMGAAGTVVAEWAGDAGRVVEYGTRFTKPVVVPASGGEVVVEGTVKAVDAETGRVTVDLTATSGGQQVLGRCVAVVRLDADTIADASPLLLVRRGLPPLLAAVGADEPEEFRQQQDELVEAWRREGNEVVPLTLPGRHHFSACDALAEAGPDVHARTVRLLLEGRLT